MTPHRYLTLFRGAIIGVAMVGPLLSQTNPTVKPGDRSAAYYYYTLGHLYAEQAGNKGDYLNKAIAKVRKNGYRVREQ